jgi:predicted TIM-barrel fold metal-dependent hydrolase
MRIVDIHTHAWTDQLAQKAMSSLLEGADGRLTPYYEGTVSGLLSEMERTGVEVSVVQPVSTKPTQVRAINDWAASIASARIVPFGSMHPGYDDPIGELHRMWELGLLGFKMHPEHQSFEPHDPRLDPVWRTASELGMIVLFHAGADAIHPTVRGTATSFVRLLDAWPDLRVVLAHMGGFRQWEQVAEHLAGRDVWLDTSYTLGHLPDDEFVDLVRAHGADRVLFGSDGPWTDPAAEIAHIRQLGLTSLELDGVLGDNAERLLGL